MKLDITKYKAALIDMDGVLYDSMKYHTLAWQRMMTELGINCSRDDFYLYEGMTGHATINLLFEKHLGRTASREETTRLYQRKSEYFKEFGEIETIPFADRLMTLLKSHGLTRVLVTGSAQVSLLGRLDTDYPGIFLPGLRVTANDVQHGKPHPEPYLIGAAKAGVDPSECIVIENAPLGVEAGHATGCFTVAVTTGPIPEQKMIDAGADIVFPSMQAFVRAIADRSEL